MDRNRTRVLARINRRSDGALVAPLDGVVLSRKVEVGTLVEPGMEAFFLADLTRAKAVFNVPARIVQDIEVGTPLRVTTDALGGVAFPGRVTAISPSGDTKRGFFNVEVTIPNADRRLKAGMIAAVEVAAPELPEIAPGTPTVSVGAVVKSSNPGAFAVFVADGPDGGATARARDVALGQISGNRVAVQSGLAIGERVIVSGARLLHDGDRVRVIPGREREGE